jgi:hypothetical protein
MECSGSPRPVALRHLLDPRRAASTRAGHSRSAFRGRDKRVRRAEMVNDSGRARSPRAASTPQQPKVRRT